ncbi:MAG: hydrogenase [Lachnospiraceae bacterium]|nr:hydrogenase [Lachnospiraceae bacterium]MBR0430218.1 hydrogenase [Lachnospiraceae bacterium]
MSTFISQPRFTCALSAQNTVLAIPRAVPIVHAGPGCSIMMSSFASAGHIGEGYVGGNQVPSTNTDESNVVFGGEKKLRDEISASLKVMKGDLFVALSGCTAGIIGDDVAGVASEFAEEGYPVVGVDTPGFKGNSFRGHEIVVEGIIEQFVGNVKPEVEQGLVNVFAVVPTQNPFWRGDVAQLKTLLEKIGLKVNILFGYTSGGVEEWKNIPNAQFNLLISPWVGKKTVELLEKKYKTPYLHIPFLPMGAKATSQFLRDVGSYAGLDSKKVEEVIRQEEKEYYQYFVGLVDFFSSLQNNLPYELFVSADSNYALGLAKFLEEEVGYIPKGIYIVDDPDAASEKLIRRIYEEQFPDYPGELLIEPDSELIIEDLEPKLATTKRALVLGSDWERIPTKKSDNLFLHVSAPISQRLIINKTYVGYKGGLSLIEDIYNNLFEAGEITGTTFQAKLND